jgi:DNA-binding Lrp family transcriptional regulator
MRVMTRSSKEQKKEDEMKILEALQRYPKENIQTIAKHCGFSKQKVYKAIKQMEKNHTIWGYATVADEQKQGLQKYVLLIKRSTKKIDNKTIDELISYQKNKKITGLEITVENSYYVHGEYDWILIFTAKDIKQAKKFSDILLSEYPGMFSNVNLIQILMTLQSQHVLNPDHIKLRELL